MSWILVAVSSLLFLVGVWKVLTKAGHPGYFALIPGFNAVMLCKLANRSPWFAIALLFPLDILLIALEVRDRNYNWCDFGFALCLFAEVNFPIAKRFGKGTVFGWGLTFMPMFFYPALGFGAAKDLHQVEPQASE